MLSKFLLLVLSVLSLSTLSSCENIKNVAAVAKRRAKAEAKLKFEEENTASFDGYGRVIRYGSTVDDIQCEEKTNKDGSIKYLCKVTDYTRRKYLTKEESIISKQMMADKQEEIDSSFGNQGNTGALKKNKFKKEQKARCKVFNEWLVEYQKDQSSNHKDFFKGYLKDNYEDFAAYRKIMDGGGGGRAGKKKAKKLKRHISLNIHQDKLPTMCSNDEIRDMMASVMAHMEEVEKCIESPHTCNPGEL